VHIEHGMLSNGEPEVGPHGSQLDNRRRRIDVERVYRQRTTGIDRHDDHRQARPAPPRRHTPREQRHGDVRPTITNSSDASNCSADSPSFDAERSSVTDGHRSAWLTTYAVRRADAATFFHGVENACVRACVRSPRRVLGYVIRSVQLLQLVLKGDSRVVSTAKAYTVAI